MLFTSVFFTPDLSKQTLFKFKVIYCLSFFLQLERLEAIAAMRRNKANPPKEELGSSSSAFQTPAASSPTGSQPDSGAYVPNEEPPSM